MSNLENNNNIIENPSQKPKNKKMDIINLILILAIFIGMGIYVVQVDGIDNIITLLKSVDYTWVIARNWNFNFVVYM